MKHTTIADVKKAEQLLDTAATCLEYAPNAHNYSQVVHITCALKRAKANHEAAMNYFWR